MFRNYLKIAFRFLLRNKRHSFINIFGLAVGIATFILLMVYVNHELSYDNFHEDYNNIYKLYVDDEEPLPSLMPALHNANIPEIDNITRIDFYRGGGEVAYLRHVSSENSRPVYCYGRF